MYFANFIALLAGGFISWLLSEITKKAFNLVRFGKLYTLLFYFFITLAPCIAYVYIFPYSGVLNGMTYIFTLTASLFGSVASMACFIVCLFRKVAVKRRFFYCQACFYSAGIYIIDRIITTIPRATLS